MNDSTPKWAMNESAPQQPYNTPSLWTNPVSDIIAERDSLSKHLVAAYVERDALAKRVEELEEANRILRAALARQEDICARTHWSGEAR